jgi:hypothetical protein
MMRRNLMIKEEWDLEWDKIVQEAKKAGCIKGETK